MSHTDPSVANQARRLALLTQWLLTNRRGGIDRALRPDRGKGSSSGCAGNRGAEAIGWRCRRTATCRTERRWIRGYPDRPSHGRGSKSEIVIGESGGLPGELVDEGIGKGRVAKGRGAGAVENATEIRRVTQLGHYHWELECEHPVRGGRISRRGKLQAEFNPELGRRERGRRVRSCPGNACDCDCARKTARCSVHGAAADGGQ